MSDVGEPTPMKREQAIRERHLQFNNEHCNECADIGWLLSELARLRTEAHQMQEANAALQAQLDERYPTAKARVE